MLTQTMLKQLLHYQPTTGCLTWLVERTARGGKIQRGDKAGFVAQSGYVLVGIDGRTYRAHRLAWLYMTGAFPVSFIDHKNGDRADNRWSNLRLITNQANGENSIRAHRDNKTGLRGVTAHVEGGFVAKIMVKGVSQYLGYFASADQAHAAYLKAKTNLHKGWCGR